MPKDAREAAALLRRAAEVAGDGGSAGTNVHAGFLLGMLYTRGHGVPRDDKQAAHWIHRAAEDEHVAAQIYLGELYREGRGVPRDDKQAAAWLGCAAESMRADSLFVLGETSDDEEEAVACYRRAGAYDHVAVQMRLVELRGDDEDWSVFAAADDFARGVHGIEPPWPRPRAAK